MIRNAYQAVLTAMLVLACGHSLHAAGYSTADDNLTVSRARPRTYRTGTTRLTASESSPTDLPAPMDPDEVFPPEGRPNQRPVVSDIGAGSAVASDQPTSGSAHAESNNNAFLGGARRGTAYDARGPMQSGPNGQVPCPDGRCDNRWGLWGDDYYCRGCPGWYGDVGAIFLWRDNRSRVQPVADSISTESTIFDTHSPDFDTGIGPRILLGVHTKNCNAWEMTYFSALDFDGNASVDSLGNLTAPGDFSQLTGWTGADQMRIDYTSELHNVEINYLHTWGRLSLLGGFRFVRLTDDFGLQATTTSNGSGSLAFSTNDYHIHSENNLYGAQLGGRYRFCCDRFFGEFTGKAGLFGNDINQSQFLTDAGGANIVRNRTSYDGTTALVADMNMSVGFQLTCNWAFRCGYNLMWIDQVALAADQLDFSLNPSSGAHVEKRGDVFLHGIDIGLEGRW